MFPEKKEAEIRQKETVSRANELAEAAHQGKNDRGVTLTSATPSASRLASGPTR